VVKSNVYETKEVWEKTGEKRFGSPHFAEFTRTVSIEAQERQKDPHVPVETQGCPLHKKVGGKQLVL
jgi:hypothetical protein